MKKFFVLLCAITLVFGMGGMARATLYDLNNATGHVIYDDVNDKYWIWDLSMFTNKTYLEQKDAIEDLTYFGTSDWIMATRTLMDGLWNALASTSEKVNDVFNASELGHNVFDTLFLDAWLGRYDEPYSDSLHYTAGSQHSYDPVSDPGGAWGYYSPGTELYHDTGDYSYLGAWAVAEAIGGPPPVPEPGTVFLLGVGLVGLITIGRKYKR